MTCSIVESPRYRTHLVQKGKPHKAGEEFKTWGERGPAKGVSTHHKTSSQFLEASDSLPSSSSINAQVLTRKVVKIAVMNLQSNPLRVQGGPNRDAHVIWKLVTLLNEGNWAARKTGARCRLGARCRDHPRPPCLPAFISPEIPVSNSMHPLATYLLITGLTVPPTAQPTMTWEQREKAGSAP